nr:xylulose kinase-1 [Tanacetum cinerariifolium]
LTITLNRLERSIHYDLQVVSEPVENSEVLPPKTVKEILARERERKAKTTLLMAILEDHLEKFHKMTDAKEMWEAIKSRFGENNESKKMQKYLLKQQFESVSTEDASQKYFRSLPSSWSQVSLIMRTKPGVDTLNFDDLYNNLRVFESGVKGSTGSSSSSQNVDEFDLEEMDLKWQVSMISTRLKKFYKKTGRKLRFDAKEPVGFDKSKVKCFNCHNTGHVARECRSKGNQDNETEDYALMAYNSSNSGSNTEMSAKNKFKFGYGSQIHDGVLSYENEDLQVYLTVGNYMPPKSDFRIDESKFTYGPKQSTTSKYNAKTSDLDSCDSNYSVETLESVPKPVANEPKAVSEPKVWSNASIIEEYELDNDDEHVTIPSKEQEKPSFSFVNTVEHIKTPRQTVKEQHTCSQNPKLNNRDWDGLMSKRMGLGYEFTKKACFVCGSFSHIIRDCDFHKKRMANQIELNKQKGKSTGPRENRPV